MLIIYYKILLIVNLKTEWKILYKLKYMNIIDKYTAI